MSRELEIRNRERAILRTLWNRPLTATELSIALIELEEFPYGWTVDHVRRELRRLHAAGRVYRLAAPSASRSVLYWA